MSGPRSPDFAPCWVKGASGPRPPDLVPCCLLGLGRRACNGWMDDSGPSMQARYELTRGCQRLSRDRDGHPSSHVTEVPSEGTMAVKWGVLAEAGGGRATAAGEPLSHRVF